MATRIVDLGSVVGPKGDTGAQGATGPQGPAGATGATGPAGMSAYQAALAGGYTGTEEVFYASLAAGGSASLPLAGGDMAGDIDMNNHFLTGLPSPVAPSDAVNFQTLIKVIMSGGIEAIARLDYFLGSTKQLEKTVSIYPKMTVGNTVLFYAEFDMSFDQGGSMGGHINGVSLKLPQQFTFRQGEWSNFDQFSDGPVQLLSLHSNGNTYPLMPKIVDGESWCSTNGETIYSTTAHVSGYFMLDWNI